MSDVIKLGLGRLVSKDPRDANYPLRQLIDPRWTKLPNSKYWPYTYRVPLDQGPYGTCVGHGWKHNLMTAPGHRQGPYTEPTAITIYNESCDNDEWIANDNHDPQYGTSVRGGAIALQKRGLIGNYHWAQTLDDAIVYLLTEGPLVIGVNWYEDMFYPDASGTIRADGSLVGGHCLLAIGAHQLDRRVRLLNSWGPNWGQNGRAWITFGDFERLMREDGEVCAATEPRVSI